MRAFGALLATISAVFAITFAPTDVAGQDLTATISGTAYTFNTHNVIAGATIRVVEFPEVSTTTAADGSYSLSFPVGSAVTPYIEAEGHGGIHLETFTLDDQHEGTSVVGANFQTPTTEVYAGLRALIASYIDRDPFEDGCVVVTTVGLKQLAGMPFEQFTYFAPHGVEGATATITPTVAQPIYFNSSVLPDVNQLTTSNDGGVLWPNVPPGTYELSATHPTEQFRTVRLRCEMGWVVNANPTWGLRAIDPTTTTPTTTTAATSTTTTTETTGTSEQTTSTSLGATTAVPATSTTGVDPADPPSALANDASTTDRTTDRGELARTGSDAPGLTGWAVGLLAVGVVLVTLARRSRASSR